MSPPAGYSPLFDPQWHYVEKVSLEAFTADDWATMNRQRSAYYAAEQGRHVLRLLSASAQDATFGYRVNNYRHCLQSATMAMRDGLDEETVVVALLHDVGFTACPTSHGDFAAALLRPYVSERHVWMLERHAIFQDVHAPTLPGVDPDARERWRGHPHFAWAEAFVAKYDQAACDPDYDEAPLETFVPMVRRIFARPPRRTVPD
jgi:predicted HD phosphohydrolase